MEFTEISNVLFRNFERFQLNTKVLGISNDSKGLRDFSQITNYFKRVGWLEEIIRYSFKAIPIFLKKFCKIIREFKDLNQISRYFTGFQEIY